MHDLWLGCEGDVLHLDGGLIQPPLRGCRIQSGQAADGRVTTTLNLALESDSPADFDLLLACLEAHLANARTWRARGLGLPVHLGIQPEAGDDTWRTPVLEGWLEMSASGVEDRLRGRMQVILRLTHPDWLEGSLVELPLSNRNGTHLGGGLTVHNHADDGHDNFVRIAGADLGGQLPGALRLACSNPLGADPLGDLTVSLNVFSNPGGFAAVLEAGAGMGGTLLADASCSGGACRQLDWSGSAEAELLTWSLSGAWVAEAGGNAFRFLLRLAQVSSYEDLWLKLRVRDAGQDVITGETDWSLVKAGCALQELGPLPLPPGELPPSAAGSPHLLTLVARRQQEEVHSLTLDALALVALDGMRRYRVVVPLPAGGELVDDAQVPVAACLPGQGWIASHVPTGASLELPPGRDACLTFFQTDPDGLAPIERTLVVRTWYRARRRFL